MMVRLEPRVMLPPMDTDPEDRWVGEVFAVMAPHLDAPPEPRALAYFTDASALAPVHGTAPTIVCAPGTPSRPTRPTSRAR